MIPQRVKQAVIQQLQKGVPTVTSESVDADELNTVAYAKDTETLNNVVSRTSGDRKIVLPKGVTKFGTFGSPDTYVIEGQGMDVTTLQSDGTDALWYDNTDAPNKDIILRDLTIDMDQVANDGRTLILSATRGDVVFDRVRVINHDLSNQSAPAGIIDYSNAGAKPAVSNIIINASEFDFSTFANRSTSDNLAVVRGDSTTSVERLFVDSETVHIGERASGSEEEYRGYSEVLVEDHARVAGTFINWDQYPTFLQADSSDAVLEAVGASIGAGGGDQWRLSCNVDGATLRFNAFVQSSAVGGDRACICTPTGGQPGLVEAEISVSNNLVGLEIRGGKIIDVDITANDTGGDGVQRPALQISDKDAPVGSLRATVNILNTSATADMEPAIELLENNSNWDDATHVIEGVARGYDSTQVDDQTDAGTTIDTNRLFG